MAPRISVIVAVWNPGPHFDALIDSLLRQTMAPADFEVLLCDDGSDETTQARLDAVEKQHSHLKVLRLDHSGWPGTPRNAGIDAATGKYVFFCDHDDRMGSEALQRLADYADANASDVVVGKLVGVGRALPRSMFRRSIAQAQLGRDPLLDILTPHKLFRTDFVRAHGIRFPDGRVRLEDHMFVMKAYFAADVISIMADYPCYYWTKRQDRPSASASRIDPEPYYHYLEVVLDIVEANVPPGPERDSLLQHWYRGKVLKRLGGRAILGYSDDYRAHLLDVVRPLVQRRFGPSIDQHLSFPIRVRSALLRSGRIDDLIALARFESGLRAFARVTSLMWDGENRLRLAVEASVSVGDGTRLRFTPAGEPGGEPGGGRWIPPEGAGTDGLGDDVLDAGRDLAVNGVEVFVRARKDGADYLLPAVPAVPAVPGLPAVPAVSGLPGLSAAGDTEEAAATLRTVVTIDPRSACGGRGLTTSDLLVQVTYAGWSLGAALQIDPALLASAPDEHPVGRRLVAVGARSRDRMFVTVRPKPAPPPRIPRQRVLSAVLDRTPPPARRLAGRVARGLRIID